ncbi:MAG: hypothetical protein WBF81_00420 [Thermoplasmata archaeon]
MTNWSNCTECGLTVRWNATQCPWCGVPRFDYGTGQTEWIVDVAAQTIQDVVRLVASAQRAGDRVAAMGRPSPNVAEDGGSAPETAAHRSPTTTHRMRTKGGAHRRKVSLAGSGTSPRADPVTESA